MKLLIVNGAVDIEMQVWLLIASVGVDTELQTCPLMVGAPVRFQGTAGKVSAYADASAETDFVEQLPFLAVFCWAPTVEEAEEEEKYASLAAA
jgi:hypothetical protein